MRLEVTRAERRTARLDEAFAAAVDDHDDPRAARATRRLEHELALGGQPGRDAAHVPLRLADVAERWGRDAPRRERRLGRLPVVDPPLARPRVVGARVAAVAPREAPRPAPARGAS